VRVRLVLLRVLAVLGVLAVVVLGLLAVRGVAALAFGLLALVWPEITVLALVLVFGAYAL
jgi:hypothetical protein